MFQRDTMIRAFHDNLIRSGLPQEVFDSLFDLSGVMSVSSSISDNHWADIRSELEQDPPY